jgi:hypothetical protein
MMRNIFLYAALVLAVAAAGLKYQTPNVMAERTGTDDRSSTPAMRPENTTPQALPFTQDWTNTGLITAADDWSAVPGIVGYLGDYLPATSPTNVDPRTVLVDMTAVDVIANLANATSTAGGVGEFEITNPVVGLQGSGTADAPNIVIYVNTTGQSNIRFSCLVRDIDDTADNAVQQVAVQYRVGNTGDFSNVPGGYIADASAGPSLTLETPLAVTLPPAANNQPNVQIRVLTTNAGGSDEWIGIDNISVTANGPVQTRRTHVDFNGDGRSDYAVTRNEGGLKVWYGQYSGTSTTFARQWGLPDDSSVPADYDGDGKTDIAVWRRDTGPGANRAYFYILNSSNGTFRADQFGSNNDDVDITGDYDGDGKADLAVFRENGTASDPCGVGKSVFYHRPSGTPGVDFRATCWGQVNDEAIPGDYDGDGKFDFVVGRNNAGQLVIYILNSSNGSFNAVQYGLFTDVFVPGDYDGDGRFDFALGRVVGTDGHFYILEADGGGTGSQPLVFGNVDPEADSLVPGDYDGDGRTDVVLWKNGSPGTFVIRRATGTFDYFPFGRTGDFFPAGEITALGN